MSLIAAVCALISFGSQTGVSSHQRLPREFEVQDDPPAVSRPLRYSSRGVAIWGGFTSYQVNVDSLQRNILGDAANEPSLCVDLHNPNLIAVGWRQFDSVSSNFRQAGYGYTTNRGLTWNFPGKLENNVFRSDPVLQARDDGQFFYLSLLTTFYETMWQSADGGANWLITGPAEGGDKQWFVVDNSFSAGRGNIYQLWDTSSPYSPFQFTRSVDNGASWMNPINIPGRPVFGVLDLDVTGTMYLCGSGNSGPEVARSTNAKFAAQTPVFDLSTAVNLGGDLGYGLTINPGGLSGQMWLAVDRSSVAATQPVYVLASIAGSGSNPCDVKFARSLNGAVSWSSALRVNDDPVNSGSYHWFGTLAVDPTGRLDVVWNDTRDDASNQTSALYYAYSLDGGQHFSANLRVSPSFNQSLGYPNQNKMGDYIGVVSNSVGANIAYTATFNGEEDVYFMNIPSPIVVVPDSISANSTTFTGNPSSLANADGNYLVTTTFFYQISRAPVDVVLNGSSPSSNPKAILFEYVAHDTVAPQPVQVSFFNWLTNSYEVVKSTSSTSVDSFWSIAAGGDLSRFVQSGTKAMRAKISLSHTAVGASRVWNCYLDKAVWNVIP